MRSALIALLGAVTNARDVTLLAEVGVKETAIEQAAAAFYDECVAKGGLFDGYIWDFASQDWEEGTPDQWVCEMSDACT